MQHRASRTVRGRHRNTTAPHRHRAPTTPVAEKGRYAVAAALVAGVGVAGASAVTDGTSSSPAAAQSRAQAAAQTPPALSAATPALSTATPAAATTTPTRPTPSATRAQGRIVRASPRPGPGTQPAGEGPSFVHQARKEKPLPLWVNPLPEAATTSCYGPRWGRLHAGVDLAAPDGTRIRAAGAGVVTAAGPADGYGNAVLIDHGNGYLTHYGHMSAITVAVGQRVRASDQIGNEGSTGHSTGPHLHFEVHQGAYQNPVEPTAWMHERGVDITGCAAAPE